MSKYFIHYTIEDDFDDDEVVAYEVEKPVDSIYGLPRVDVINRGGPITLYEGDIDNIEAAKPLKSMVFVDLEASKEHESKKNKDGWPMYVIYKGLDIVQLVYANPETIEIVDWEYYNKNYERLHEEYLKNHPEGDAASSKLHNEEDEG